MENTLTPHKKMATKIEGYIGDTAEQWLKDNYHGAVLFRKTEGVGELSATLIIHDGPPERCFTASEVSLSNERLLKRVLLDVMDFNAAGQSIATLLAEKYGITIKSPLTP